MAETPNEGDLKRVLYRMGRDDQYNQEEVAEILQKWVKSANAEKQALAAKYFKSLGYNAQPAKEIFCAWALENKVAGAYDMVVPWVRQTAMFDGPSPQKRDALAEKIASLVSSDAKLKSVVTGSFVSTSSGKDPVKELRLGGERSEFLLAHALQENGALAEVANLKVGLAPPQPLSPNLTDWNKFSDSVLNTPVPALFDELERIRERLGPETHPTRMELTKKMIDVATAGEPQVAQALRKSMATEMVKAETDRYPFRNDPKKYITLNISLRDGADLEAARMLADSGALEGTKRINWNNVEEVSSKKNWDKVRWPTSTQVREEEGGVRALLDKGNFELAKLGQPKVWRTEEFRTRSMYFTPEGCAVAAGSMVPTGNQTKGNP